MANNIHLSFVRAYRSIKSFSNTTLPELTVICGPNGCGKTQLLSAIDLGNILAKDGAGNLLSSKIFHSTPELKASNVSHGELIASQNAALDTYDLIEKLEEFFASGLQTNIYFNNTWRPLDRATMMQAINHYLTRGGAPQFNTGAASEATMLLNSVPDRSGNARNRWEAFRRFVPAKAISYIANFTAVDLKSAIFNFVQYQTFMEVDMSIVFYRYFEEVQNNAYRQANGRPHLNDDQFKQKFGSPPWDEVNALLDKYGFSHKVLPPSSDDDPRATNGYMATIINELGEIIPVNDLSSGEKVIIALLLSAYAAQQKQSKIFQVDVPDIILFDELDAHLHPSMTRMMFDVLQKSIIDKLSSRVIITTHSPSTVALAPPSSVFRLTATPTHHLDHVDSATACRDLSEGFIQIMDGSQIAIVEGKDDPLFYRAVERALRSNGDLSTTPTLHFIPASQTSNPSTGGGAHAAEDWANKLQDARLPNIHALLDNDGHRTNSGTIKVLDGRYAIENFVLDPLSLAVALITDQRLGQIDSSLAIKFPQVSSISTSSLPDLQELVDKICSYIEGHTSGLATPNKVLVNYRLGKQINVPEWVCKRRGKDLVGIVRDAFKNLSSSYIITRKDTGDYDLELGYLLKLWSQHPNYFPVNLMDTLKLLKA